MSVNRWKPTFALLLALLYLAATGHCFLEQAGWFPSDCGCCERASSTGSSQDSACGEGVCSVENAAYFSTFNNVVPPELPQVFVCELAQPPASGLESRFFQSPETSPPELAKIWQFIRRAALPARAPSFVS